MADTTGPPVEALTRRLAACPADFTDPAVAVNALLADVMEDAGIGVLHPTWHDALSGPQEPDLLAWRRAVAIVAWLAAGPELAGLLDDESLLRFLTGELHALCAHVAPAALTSDSDRREELARLVLRAAGAVPAGETPAQAADRLATLDTATRLAVVREARAAEEHAREVREALARKAAVEAAARATRE